MTRLVKADGGNMNAPAWIAGHVAWQWTLRAARAARAAGVDDAEARRFMALKREVMPYANGSTDPSPPSVARARELLAMSERETGWLETATPDLMATLSHEGPPLPDTPAAQELDAWIARADENLGTTYLRGILHAWFHLGEIDLIAQVLGRPPIPMLGPIDGWIEWHREGTLPANEVARYRPEDLGRFSIHSFERGLEGLTDEDARKRLSKADGSLTNSASWIAAHVGRHWISAARGATGILAPDSMDSFASGSDDPTPPSLADAMAVLHASPAALAWIETADEHLLLRSADPASNHPEETLGTRILRATLHTWFHIGEVNGIRQMLGHKEIAFVGPMVGRMEWQPEYKRASLAPSR
jgi:hypothetical protein